MYKPTDAKAIGTVLCLPALVQDVKRRKSNTRTSTQLMHILPNCDNTSELLWASPPGKNAGEIQLLLNYNPIMYFIHHLMLFDYLSLISFYNSKWFSEETQLCWSPSVRKPFYWKPPWWRLPGPSSGQCGNGVRSLIVKTWSKAVISSPLGLYPCCFSSLLLLLYSCFKWELHSSALPLNLTHFSITSTHCHSHRNWNIEC